MFFTSVRLLAMSSVVSLYVVSQSANNPLPPTTPLVIGGFFPLSNSPKSGLGHGVKLATEMALRDIAAHPTLLAGYNLTMVLEDTQCKASVGTKAFFDLMKTKERKLVIFGDACTAVNEPIALAAKYWKMVQISYAETHPKFSAPTVEGGDKSSKYTGFYRLVPSEHDLNRARFRFLKEFNWTNVGTIYQRDLPEFALIHESFTSGLESKLVKVTKTESISSTTNSDTLSKHLAELKAYDKGLYGGDYVWILPGFHDDLWWHKKVDNLNCDFQSFLKSLEGHFIIEFVTLRHDKQKTESGKRAEDYDYAFRKRCIDEPLCEYSPYHGYAYDGVWMIAKSIEKLSHIYGLKYGDSFDPNQPDFDQELWEKNFMEALNVTVIQGVTGKVKFEHNQRRGKYRIAQFQNRSYVQVGEYDAAEQIFRVNQDQVVWARGKKPRDSTMVITEHRYISYVIFCIMCALTAIGMTLALCFLAVNVYFRSHRFIKMSSPNMNNLIIIGSLLTYTSVVLLGLDTKLLSLQGFEILCTVKLWVLCSGFTLAFGSMFSKTWRVHSIFTNIKLNKKAIKDYQLFLIVGVLLLLDAVLLSVWAGLSPMYVTVKDLPQEKDPIKEVVIQPKVQYCESKYGSVFQGIIFGYKGLLLLLGCYLAWETKQVNVPALNDSKYIGMSVYNVVIMCAVGVALTFILHNRINESFALTSIFIIFCATITNCFVFMPKIIELIRNPKGNERRYRATLMKGGQSATTMAGGRHGPSSRGDSNSSLLNANFQEQLVKTEQDNQIWRRMMDERSKELQEILRQLRELGDDVLAEPSSSQFKDSAIDNSSGVSRSEPASAGFGGVYIGPPDQPPQPLPSARLRTSNQIVPSPAAARTDLTHQSPLFTHSPNDHDEKTSLLNDASPKRNAFSRLRNSFHSSSPSREDPVYLRTPSIYYSFHELDEVGAESIPLNSGVGEEEEDEEVYSPGHSRLRYIDSLLSAEDQQHQQHPAHNHANSLPRDDSYASQSALMLNSPLVVLPWQDPELQTTEV